MNIRRAIAGTVAEAVAGGVVIALGFQLLSLSPPGWLMGHEWSAWLGCLAGLAIGVRNRSARSVARGLFGGFLLGVLSSIALGGVARIDWAPPGIWMSAFNAAVIFFGVGRLSRSSGLNGSSAQNRWSAPVAAVSALMMFAVMGRYEIWWANAHGRPLSAIASLILFSSTSTFALLPLYLLSSTRAVLASGVDSVFDERN